MLLVVTTTCARENNSSTSATVVGIWRSTHTAGYSDVAARIIAPCLFSTPRVRNFSAICVLSASVGTITSTLEHPAETRIESIVSVFPVPVGMTIVAGVVATDQ
jgi:hypothetical protein